MKFNKLSVLGRGILLFLKSIQLLLYLQVSVLAFQSHSFRNIYCYTPTVAKTSGLFRALKATSENRNICVITIFLAYKLQFVITIFNFYKSKENFFNLSLDLPLLQFFFHDYTLEF